MHDVEPTITNDHLPYYGETKKEIIIFKCPVLFRIIDSYVEEITPLNLPYHRLISMMMDSYFMYISWGQPPIDYVNIHEDIPQISDVNLNIELDAIRAIYDMIIQCVDTLETMCNYLEGKLMLASFMELIAFSRTKKTISIQIDSNKKIIN